MHKAIILVLLVALFAFTAAQSSTEVDRAIKHLSRGFGKKFAELARAKYTKELQDEEAPAPLPPVRRKKKSFFKRIGHFAGRMFRQVARNWVQQNTGISLQDEEAPAPQPPVRRKKKSFWKRFGHSFGKVFRNVGRQLIQQHTGLQLQDEEAPAPVQPPVRRKKKSFWKRFGHSFGKVFRNVGRQLIQQHTGLQLQDEEEVPAPQPPVRRKKKSFWKRFGHSFGKVFRSVGRQLIQQRTGLQLQDEEAPAPQPPVRRKKKSFWKRLGKSFGEIFRQVGRQFIQQRTGIFLQDIEVPAVRRTNKKIKIVCKRLGERFAKEIQRAVELQDEEPAPEQPAPVDVSPPQARGHCHADGSAYLRLYPDVANAKVDPIAHYMNHGYSEGRHFCVKCDGVAFSECGAWNDAGYLQNSPDVAAVYGTAHGRGFAHWKDHGNREPRNIAISGPYQV